MEPAVHSMFTEIGQSHYKTKDPYDQKVREQLISNQICKLDPTFETVGANAQMKVYDLAAVTTLKSAIVMCMARKTIEQATNTLKNVKKEFSKRITDPIDSMQKKSQDINSLNTCKWILEANNLNNNTKRPTKQSPAPT